MSYELNRHKKSDAIKWVVVFVLILALVAGMLAVFTGGYKNWDVKTWFGQTECQHEYVDGKCTKCGEAEPTPDPVPDNPVKDKEGNILDNPVNALPSSGLLFASSLAETFAADDTPTYNNSNTVTVTATISPATADDKTVDWAVNWSNASSSWASGKIVTDYLTVSPQSDGSLTATITCNQAFGEQIIITVTSRQNTNATASVTVDYYAKPQTVSVSANDTAMDSSTVLSKSTTFALTATGVGTLNENYNYAIKVRFTPEFGRYAETFKDSSLGDMSLSDYVGTDFSTTVTLNTMTFSIEDSVIAPLCKAKNPASYSGSDFVSFFIAAMKTYSGKVFNFTFTATGATTGVNASVDYDVAVSAASLFVGVNSVSISGGAIAF